MNEPLFLIRLALDRRMVLRVGARHRLGGGVDDGALLHAGLAQLFAHSTERARVPLYSFAVDDFRGGPLTHPERVWLLAYAGVPHDQLIEAMGPARRELLLQCESREMPAFEPGQRLGFRTRACPVVRTRQPGRRELTVAANGRTRHREIDAFVHATLARQVATVTREDVYVQWLYPQLQRLGAARLESGRLAEFRREVMRRRAGTRIERPNAVLEGTLTVENPEAFRQLLARGVGRHRAYGFGMLLLRPAQGVM
jgi:CRISPR system Cascade subunit CasE